MLDREEVPRPLMAGPISPAARARRLPRIYRQLEYKPTRHFVSDLSARRKAFCWSRFSIVNMSAFARLVSEPISTSIIFTISRPGLAEVRCTVVPRNSDPGQAVHRTVLQRPRFNPSQRQGECTLGGQPRLIETDCPQAFMQS